MANLANVLNPEMFVLGGGMIEAMEYLILPEARRVMETYLLAPLVGIHRYHIIFCAERFIAFHAGNAFGLARKFASSTCRTRQKIQNI